MKAVCPNNKEHKRFITVAHIAQDWVVDEYGNFLEVSEDCTETVAFPDSRNTWTCKECGAEATVSDMDMSLEKAIDETITDCKKIWSRWALDERDGKIQTLEILESNFGRKMLPIEISDERTQALLSWVKAVSERGNQLAYAKRVENSQETAGKYEDEWNAAKSTEPELL